MVTRKLTTFTRDCNKFAAIVDEHALLSGENDSTWLARCYRRFSETWVFAFIHYEAWDVLKNHHKWHGVKAVVPERCVRTVEDIEEPNELFRGVTIPRPPCKPRPSKSQNPTSPDQRVHLRREEKISMKWSKKSYRLNVKKNSRN
ncbi:hypothetical protein Tco_1340464 [Tanacetum coccineum]